MPAGIVTALKAQQRSKGRVNVYLDGAYAFSLDATAAAALRVGQVLTEDDVRVLREADSVAQAVGSAARFLAHRPRSVAEVQRNLAEKGFAAPVIAAAVGHLMALGYLDDRAFAVFWIENRTQFKPLGPRALRFELRRHGVPDAVIDDALRDVDAVASAYRAAIGQRRKLRAASRAEQRAKLAAFLQRRGFDHDTISEVLGRLENETRAENLDGPADTTDTD